MTMATTQKGSYFSGLEKLARVCCDVLDGKLDVDNEPPKIKEELMADLVANLAIKFPTKKRSVLMIPREEEQNAKINIITATNKIQQNNHRNNDFSDRPPKRRPGLDLKRRLLDEEIETGVKTSTTKRMKKNNSDNKNSGKRGIMAGPDPAPAMPEKLLEMVAREFDVSTLTLVIQKSLFKTDLEKGENRLSMTLKQINSDDFLTEAEKRTLERRRQDNHKEGIEVRFIEPNKDLSKTEMELRKWDLSNSSSYVLTQNWFKVAHRNGLKEKEIVQIWFFRSREGKPCFALVNLGREGASPSSSSSSSSFVREDDHEMSASEPRSTVTA